MYEVGGIQTKIGEGQKRKGTRVKVEEKRYFGEGCAILRIWGGGGGVHICETGYIQKRRTEGEGYMDENREKGVY